jgi:hypothetical protein
LAPANSFRRTVDFDLSSRRLRRAGKASTTANDYATNGYKADSTDERIAGNRLYFAAYFARRKRHRQNQKGTEGMTGAAHKQAIDKNIADLQRWNKEKRLKARTFAFRNSTAGIFIICMKRCRSETCAWFYSPPSNIGISAATRTISSGRGTRRFYVSARIRRARRFVCRIFDGKCAVQTEKIFNRVAERRQENEFLMVMGYPGGTTRYRESQSIQYSQDVNFPFLAGYLRTWADALTAVGEEDDAKRIKYKGDIQSYNNGRKVYEGNTVALRRSDFLTQKRNEELKFASWVAANPTRQAKYGNVLTNLQSGSTEYYRMGKRDRILRQFPNAASTPVFKQVYDAITAVQEGKALTAEKRTEIETAYKDREPVVEREILKFFLRSVAELPDDQKFQTAENLFSRFKGRERRSAEETFAESIAESIPEKVNFDTPQKIIALYGMSLNDLRKRYPNIVEFVLALAQERAAITARTNKFNSEIDSQRLLYQQGMAEMNRSNPYPDANATFRFSYGYVRGYNPREAVTYSPFTTLKGMIEKDTGEEPFNVPQQIKDLQRARDFGRYGVGDSVPVNFLATTDIIGGNSGSPILNGLGEQVGIVFDGNFEGLANDLFYNEARGRTIAVDIRYVLFVTEKIGGADWIFNEMTIKGRTPAKTRRAVAE